MDIGKWICLGALSGLAFSANAGVLKLDEWNDTRLFDARIGIGKNVYKISDSNIESAVASSVKSPNQKVVFGYNLPIALFAATEENLGKVNSKGVNVWETLLNNDSLIFPFETSLGWTPLHAAALNSESDKNSEVTIDLLLKDGRININEQNSDGDTALMLAIRSQNYGAAEKILKYKPGKSDGEPLDLSLKNKKGETAAILVLRSKNDDLVSAYKTACGIDTSKSGN